MTVSIHEKVELAVGIIADADNVVTLTGAGISTPSGIPDFRSPTTGLWENVDLTEVASIDSFRQDPTVFYDWIRPLLKLMMAAEPNSAHYALAELESHGPLKSIITQNIDALHTVAGSKTVYEVHGHYRTSTCISCHASYETSELLPDFIESGDVPTCLRCRSVVKPNLILYGELLPMHIYNSAERAAVTTDVFIVAGTSLEVTPISELPALAHAAGARIIIVNKENTYADYLADVVIQADVADIMPMLVKPFSPTAAF